MHQAVQTWEFVVGPYSHEQALLRYTVLRSGRRFNGIRLAMIGLANNQETYPGHTFRDTPGRSQKVLEALTPGCQATNETNDWRIIGEAKFRTCGRNIALR